MLHEKSQHSPPGSAAVAEQAAAWLARRDRGLTAAEQDDYTQWLAASPRHLEAVQEHAAAFERMMKLYEWQPGPSGGEPNPDLFAPRRRWRRSRAAGFFAIAAAIALCATGWWMRSGRTSANVAPSAYLRVNERMALPDGSVVELKDGSRVVVEFSPTERRLRLTGEAHFQVASNPQRPFIVEASGVSVRAVGTAFNVRIEPEAVQVVVTEGTVRVASPPAKSADGAAAAPVGEPAVVTAGQQATVSLADAATKTPRVSDITEAEAAEALEWQAPRLQFFETPLSIALAEFNSRNRLQVSLAGEELGAIPIGGTFRVDNVEGFVRLLEVTLELKSARRGEDAIVVMRAR